MKTTLTILIFFLFVIQIHGQCDKDLKMYKHYKIETKFDTINYHIYSKKGLDSISNILLFVQGSGAFPMFQIERNSEGMSMVSTVPFDLKTIPDEYAFVLISKRGIPFCAALNEKIKVPKVYYENEGLTDRAERISKVIDHLLTDSLIKKTKKLVVLGHSEGSDVVAKLGTITLVYHKNNYAFFENTDR